MDKGTWDLLFQKFKGGCFAVDYWDGSRRLYGSGQPAFVCRFNRQPSLAVSAADPVLSLGELYMEGDLDFEGDLVEMFRLVHLNYRPGGWAGRARAALRRGLSRLSPGSQKKNIKAHYDLGNDFFRLWLDESLTYSCAYFQKPTDSLAEAQRRKVDLILKKLRLKAGQRLLDIGCGWGFLLMRACELYGVRGLGVTLSEEQYAEGRRRLAEAGLSDRLELRLANYLDLAEAPESFDAIVSVGMFEHVGQAFHRKYLAKVQSLLKPGGLTLLHSLTSQTERETNSWIQKYIFPGGYIPSLRQLIEPLPDYDFYTLHLESLRLHYVRTLELWYENFSAPSVRDKVLAMFGERFVRMWSLYLVGAASSLRCGQLDVHQLLLSKGPNNELPLTWQDLYQ